MALQNYRVAAELSAGHCAVSRWPYWGVVVVNSRLSPYTPQSVAASLAAVKRAEHAALNQTQKHSTTHTEDSQPTQVPACKRAHTHTKDHRSNNLPTHKGKVQRESTNVRPNPVEASHLARHLGSGGFHLGVLDSPPAPSLPIMPTRGHSYHLASSVRRSAMHMASGLHRPVGRRPVARRSFPRLGRGRVHLGVIVLLLAAGEDTDDAIPGFVDRQSDDHNACRPAPHERESRPRLE